MRQKAVIAAIIYASLVIVSSPRAQMMEQMQDHMGGGTGGPTEERQTQEQGLSQEAAAGNVTVKVTYMKPSENLAPRFKVALDTHTVELDKYKIDEITVLRDDAGKVYRGFVVSSSGSGHHREAVIEFLGADISPAKYLELAVKNLAGVDERVFRFTLDKGY